MANAYGTGWAHRSAKPAWGVPRLGVPRLGFRLRYGREVAKRPRACVSACVCVRARYAQHRPPAASIPSESGATSSSSIWSISPPFAPVRIPACATIASKAHSEGVLGRRGSHTHAHTHAYTHTRTRIHTHTRTLTRIHTHTHTHKHTHTHPHTHTHAHAHTHTHTHVWCVRAGGPRKDGPARRRRRRRPRRG